MGAAAVAVRHYPIERRPPAVIDSALRTGISEPEVVAAGPSLSQVLCSCRVDVAGQRVRDRWRWDSGSADADFERFRPLVEPLRLPLPLVMVDTSGPLDVDGILAQLRSLPITG